MPFNDQLRIREYDEALQVIAELREQVERGEVMSVIVLCERTDGGFWGACTSSQNAFALAGYMISWAMQRMGFLWGQYGPKARGSDNV